MKNKKWVKFVESFILVPVVAMSGSLSTVGEPNPDVVSASPIIFSQYNSIFANGTLAVKDAMDQKLEDQKAKADAIDAYFRARKMPMAGMGMKMVIEAEKNGLDWRLLPAIAVRESTGGKNACNKVRYNSFGWGSCKIGFKSIEMAIEIVAKNLGGNNPNTAYHYDNKTTEQLLRAYNPPSIAPRYVAQVMAIMNSIGVADVIPNTPESSSDPLAQKG